MADTKYLSYSDVDKIPGLDVRNEKLCYMNRYNAQVATLNGNYADSEKWNSAFMGFKYAVPQPRYYEIMNLADENFYKEHNEEF